MPSLVFPSLVRSQVLEQHGELRELLHRVREHFASSDPVGELHDLALLRAAAHELHGRFAAHLAFEQVVLPPVFAVLDGWGPERVQELGREHRRQREQLDDVLRRFDSALDVAELKADLCALVDELVRDMDEEEQGCLRASLLSADSLSYERR